MQDRRIRAAAKVQLRGVLTGYQCFAAISMNVKKFEGDALQRFTHAYHARTHIIINAIVCALW